MNPIIKEAIKITEELGSVTFIGAVAVILQKGRQRASEDLDFVVVEQISDETFLNLNYKPYKKTWVTSRNYKIDVYHSHDLKGIPLQQIIDTADEIEVKKGTTVRAICLEGLMVSKLRAGRPQDIEDLKFLASNCHRRVNYASLEDFSKPEEFIELKNVIKFHST